MKKIVAVLVAILLAGGNAFAITTAGTPIDVPVSASVDGSLSLTVNLFDYEGGAFTTSVTTMSFGQLMEGTYDHDQNPATPEIPTGALRSTKAVAAFVNANTHGDPYELRQTGTALSNGVATIPAGACTVVPVYVAQDNGGLTIPAGAAVGAAGSWVAADKVLYASESGTASMRTIQAYYSVTDANDPNAVGATESVPTDQPGGTYNAQITFTVAVL